ncbi:fibrillin-1-like isoform X2 [Hylaeus volcanicus]|uniref:fibrillin-1-like isoform X2 n=1 Tax=Hylaeus volcanicus TaxID=313075 RepID=UPI0023B7C00A|nr:fibrillin-1-like isoform X2 [Hylaeus volcanicus]
MKILFHFIFLLTAEIANGVGTVIQSARSYRNSRNPVAYMPYEIKPQSSEKNEPVSYSLHDVVGKIADCDPHVHGTCCLFPTICVSNAVCSAKRPSMSLDSIVTAVPKCSCLPGYIGDGRTRGTGCSNINECETGEALCEHLCNDSIPGYTCSCYKGYRLGKDNYSCLDVDECLEKSHKCSHICLNTQGSYECECPQGHELSTDGFTCEPINECLLMKEIMAYQLEFSKQNSTARLSSRAQKALPTLEVCEYPELCVDVEEGYYCGCPLGYENDKHNLAHCIDINECEEGLHVVSLTSTGQERISKTIACDSKIEGVQSKNCRNVIGGYICVCLKGFTLENEIIPSEELFYRTTASIKIFGALAHNAFYERWQNLMQQLTCKDINECEEQDICVPVHHKNNKKLVEPGFVNGIIPLGSFSNSHYEALSESPSCKNTIGSYICACLEGYEFLKEIGLCRDVNECQISNGDVCNKSSGESCINLPGSYACRCGPGYKEKSTHEASSLLSHAVGIGHIVAQCIDIDECAEGISQCQYGCENTVGSYKCTCPNGYLTDPDDPTKCKDIDECSLSLCGFLTACVNLPGSFICACPKGYVAKDFSPFTSNVDTIFNLLTPKNRVLFSSLLHLVDSVNEKPMNHENQKILHEAVEIIRSDLMLQTDACVDLDECLLTQNLLCPETTQCRNGEGFYTCQCPDGYRWKKNNNERNTAQVSHEQSVVQPDISFNSQLPALPLTSFLLGRKPLKPSEALSNISRSVSIFHRQHQRSLDEKDTSLGRTLTRTMAERYRVLLHNFTPVSINYIIDTLQPSHISHAAHVNLIRSQALIVPPFLLLSFNEMQSLPDLRGNAICEDIDECKEFQAQRSAQRSRCTMTQPCCINTPGSFICAPKKRYRLRWLCPS